MTIAQTGLLRGDGENWLVLSIPAISGLLSGLGEEANQLPTPNVLMEYGYTLRHHGHLRLIAVMNTA
jgi:hypothetical protein